MIFGMEGKNCRTTIINGKVLTKTEFVGLDEEKIKRMDHGAESKALSKLNHRVY